MALVSHTALLRQEIPQRQWPSRGRSQPKKPAKIRSTVKNSQPSFLRLMIRNRAGSISSTVRQIIARVKTELELPNPAPGEALIAQ